MKQLILAMLTPMLLIACDKTPAEEQSTGADDPLSTESVSQPKNIDVIVAIGKVEPENEIIYLSAGSGGVVTAVHKKDGDPVRKGDPLVQLDDDIERLQIAQVRKQIATQQTQIELDRTAIRETEARLTSKRRDLGATSRLAETGAETAQEVTDLETDIELLEIELEKNRLAVERSAHQLAELEQQLKLYETQAARKILRAPADGHVLDMLVHPGNALNQYANFVEFAGAGNVLIRAEVDELFAIRVEAGQIVEIRLTGHGETVATGKVATLSPYLKKKSLFSETPGEREDRLVREIRIALDGQPSLLLNSKVECVVKMGS